MDNTEYTIKKEEIKELIDQKEYAQAAEIADTIDWRRVRSVMMLCTVSDLYKINRRYEDAKNMLLLAYDIRPGGRAICYSLCELCIKTEEFVQAVKYYKEYIQAAPKDPDRYVLQYKLYEAQDVSLEERIEVLKELKKRDYREKWAYELAYLYHRIGQATLCVEECDELILWFGEGKYVYKAMELKMLHQPLSPAQQEKYDHRLDKLQGQPQMSENADARTAVKEQLKPQEAENAERLEKSADMRSDNAAEPVAAEKQPEEKQDDMDIQVKTVDVGQYNTINLQAELAAGLQEVLEKENKAGNDAITRAIIAPMLESDTERLDVPEVEENDEDELVPEAEEMERTEVFFGETGEIGSVPPESLPEISGETDGDTKIFRRVRPEEVRELLSDSEPVKDETAELVMSQMRIESEAEEQAMKAQPPKELAGVLSQEADGQISLVVSEKEPVEKQITGQMNIQDILTEWERMKRENEEKRKEEVRQHVLEQTGNMFTEFEAAVRDNLLEQLESGNPSAEEQMKEAEEVADAEEQYLSEHPEVAKERAESGDMDEEDDEVEEIEEIRESENIEEPGEDEEPEEIEVTETAEEPEENLEAETAEGPEENLEEEEMETEPEKAAEVAESEDEESEETEEAEESTEEPKEPEDDEVEEIEEIGEPENVEEPEEGEEPEEIEVTETAEEPEDSEEPKEQERQKARMLTREEKELYAPFVQSRSAREQLVRAIDNISLAAYTGNVIVTGEEGMDTITLAKNMIREIQMTDSNFSGKVAKISGKGLNSKNVDEILQQLKNGALIVQKASEIDSKTAAALHKALQQETLGIIIVLEDTKKGIAKLFSENSKLQESFTARMDMEALSDDMLVSFGRQYAREKEYFIDDLGVLALHTRIEELQTIDHVVTVLEVKKIVDEAIRHANRKTLGHFFDVLFARRYDDEDMIILTEKDFV